MTCGKSMSTKRQSSGRPTWLEANLEAYAQRNIVPGHAVPLFTRHSAVSPPHHGLTRSFGRYKEVMPAAPPPSPLPRFAASFNAVTLQAEAGPHRGPVTRLCLFGGSTQANDFLDDTTFLDPLAKVWEPVTAVGEQETVVRPMMRWGHAAVTFRNHVVLFGT